MGLYARPEWSDNTHSVVFAARRLDGELAPQRDEADDAKFFRAADLPERLSGWHRRPIRDAIAGVGGSAVWHQDMRWPTGWQTPHELFALRARGPLPEAIVRAGWEAWCREPHRGEQRREIEG